MMSHSHPTGEKTFLLLFPPAPAISNVSWLACLCWWLFLFFFLLSPALARAQGLDPKIKRILFLGNSITYSGKYVADVEAFLLTRYPDREWEFINVGLPSETVSGLSEEGHAGGSFPRPVLQERLQRVLHQTQPDLVFALYGMNDGIYLPFDANRFQKFKEGLHHLHTEVEKTGALIIHLTPPDYDEEKGKSPGYRAVLDRYADWMLRQRFSARWEVIDIHYPMQKYLRAHRRVDRKFGLDGFALAADGVHPGETGHWLIAREILLYLGHQEVAKSASIAETLNGHPYRDQIRKLVTERQVLLRDAWLTATGHQRPGLPAGLPLAEAQEKAATLQREIRELIQQKR